MIYRALYMFIGNYSKVLNSRLSANLSTILYLHVYRGGQVYWWQKPEYPEKTTDLS